MHRHRIVSTAQVVLLPILGFALVYGLPMLGLNFAIDHGLYVAAGIAAASFLRLDGDERVGVLEYCTGTDGVQLALVEIDGDLEYGDGLGALRLAVEVDRLSVHVDDVEQTDSGDATEKPVTGHVVDADDFLRSQEKGVRPAQPLFRRSPEKSAADLFRGDAKKSVTSDLAGSRKVTGVHNLGGAA